jgi:hypothetical protein
MSEGIATNGLALKISANLEDIFDTRLTAK